MQGRSTPRGGASGAPDAEALLPQLQASLTMPQSERQRVARALRVAAPRTFALCLLASVRSLLASRACCPADSPCQLAGVGAAAAALARAHGPALWLGWDVARRNVYCEARPPSAAARR